MIFNAFDFLFVFLPLTLALFFMPGLREARPYVLIAASLVFYGLAGLEHALVLTIDILWVYAIINLKGFRQNRFLLACAIFPPVLALAYYKYATFLIGTFFDLDLAANQERFSLLVNVLLPAGISFFTFQLLSFAIDRYRGDIQEMPSLPRFAAYISFFPQLVAGPILRYRDVAVPLRRLITFNLDGARAARGIGYICLGLAAKVLIADTLSHYLAGYRDHPEALDQIAGLYVIFAYSFQIYFDFYGYSMIAIGLGALFGFDFPHNFKRPYSALNPRDFWRRWHITLSFWIRDYLYIPLGGNSAYTRNILIVMAACGLWHGAGWTFVVWGLYHALLVIGYHHGQGRWDRLPQVIQCAITFTLVSIGWILFLYDFDGVSAFVQSLIGLSSGTVAAPSLEMWGVLLTAALVCFTIHLEPWAENNHKNPWWVTTTNVGFAILFVTTLMFLNRSETFIYFRF